MRDKGFATRDLPEPPRNLWRIVGPGVMAAGVGLSSGEFVLWPYIASQVGLVFLWGAALGVITQFFLNMEIERYTLATAETAMTGFNLFWKHWAWCSASSFLLIMLNRRALPAAIAPGPFRIATLAWATLCFGVLSGLTIWQQALQFL